MKNIYLFLLLLFPLLTFAQHETQPGILLLPENGSLTSSSAKTTACRDTLNKYQQRTDSFTIWNAGDGYTFGVGDNGNGARYTDATGIHFDSVGHISVEEIFIWIGAKKLIGSPDAIKIELYNAGPDSMPFNLVGFGTANMAFVNSSLSVNFLSMTGLAKFIISTGSKQVTSDFFISLNYTGVDDTFGIVTGIQGKGYGEKRTRQLLSLDFGASWVRISDFWNVGGNPLDTDIMLIPVVECVDVGTDPGVFSNEHFTVIPAYPNPAQTECNIRVELPKATQVQVLVFDANGKFLYDSGLEDRTPGVHDYLIDVSELPAATYYYQVRTSETQVASRFNVVR
ncbi:MAG: T9SS type A sorting domain-containing protein [Bacteroidia bacterium]|nr:T9SS type A sorting domain-containing protein [Bacteroidia bacterium]